MQLPIHLGVRARGPGGCSPPDSDKAIIFRAEASSQKWKTNIFVYIKRKNGIHSV